MLGEAALKIKQRRVCDVVAHDWCQAMVLYKYDYEAAISSFLLAKKRDFEGLLRNMDIVKEWNLVKIGAYLEAL